MRESGKVGKRKSEVTGARGVATYKLKEELYKKVGSAASIRWGGLRKLVRGGK